MLKLLIESKQQTESILIEDTALLKGGDLYRAFLKNHASTNNVKEIHLFCYENPPQFYSMNEDSRIISYDCYSDPCGWLEESKKVVLCSEQMNIFNLKDPQNAIIMIDSLSALVTHLGFTNVYRDLHNLCKLVKKVICLVHCDVLCNNDALKKLEFLFKTVLILSEPAKDMKKKNLRTYVVDVLYKKTGGKVSREKEILHIDSDSSVFVVKLEEKKKEVKTSTHNQVEQMENLTTFKLGLKMSETEKMARSNLVLPYLRNSSQSGGGRIIYEADASDDLEEDPDDDLDI